MTCDKMVEPLTAVRSSLRLTLALVAAAAALSIGAPARAEEKVLTLDQAIASSMRLNPQIVGARESLAASSSKVLEARSGYLPSATAVLAYKRTTLNSPASPVSGSGNLASITDPTARALAAQLAQQTTASRDSSDNYNNYTASVAVNQTIYDFGRTGGSYDASKAGVESAAADLRSARDAVYLSAVQGFFNVLAMQESLAVANETKKQMEKHLDLAQTQLAAGVRTRIDVTRAQSDLSSASLTVIKAINALAVARANLNNVMGTPDQGDYRVERPAAAAVPAVGSVDEAVKEALKRRPEYQSLREKVRALEGTLVAVKSAYYPALAANGTLTYNGYELGGKVYNWALGATAPWNFFSGLNTQSTVQETEAAIRALQANLANLELGIRLEIESAVYSYREARETMPPSQALLASARETLELSDARYAAGTGNIVEVTDSQALYVQARANLIEAEFNLEVARVKLLKAIEQVPITD